MTTHDSYPASTDDGLAAPPAPRTEREEPTLGSGESFSESTRSDQGLGEETRPDRGGNGSRGGTGDDVGQSGALIAVEAGADFRARWKVVQGDFIDEPRKAVTDADSMVGEVLDQLAETFRQQRKSLEQNWANDESSTEDLRIALRRYRTFFDRLLSL
jgi:hypothetical protein